MFKQFFPAVVAVVFLLAAPLSLQAQTLNMSEAVARMNTIIAEMEKLRTEFSALAAAVGKPTTPTPAVLGDQTSAVFTQSLAYGETNDDIKRIQKLLATDSEIYPYGVASGFFGPKTEEGIRNFQTRFGLDPVGAVGPATTALLELFMKAYPDGNYPAGVLKQKPQVQGASVSNPPTTPTNTPPAYTGTNAAKSIKVAFSGGESLIEIQYTNGNRKGLVADTTDKEEVIEYIASHTVLTDAMIRHVIDFTGRSDDDDDDDESEDSDEGDAEDALEEAEDAIDDAEEEIEDAEVDGDDTDWAEDTLDDAIEAFEEAEEAYDDEDYDDVVKLARKAKDLAHDAEDRIDEEKEVGSGDTDEIEKIEVDIHDGESDVTVEYEDGSEEGFTVEEDKEDSIIEEVADELNMDEDDVEDVIEFDYGKVSHIEIRIEDDGTLARVFYTSDVERRVRLDETDEDDIIEAIAAEIDEDEEDVEDWADFL